ncbi:MAG: response regulator [Desulfobulbaceae bacterium]|nr:response regulator [Desulfobulbaceae bacterium]
MGKKILVVDDSSLMRGFAKSSLKQLKLNNVTEAEDGVEALAELKKEKYDLILSDLYMPNMDGLELLKAVRNDRDLKNIPFIIMTIKGKKESLKEALEAGLNDYLIKPVTTNDLSKKLNKVFE